MLKRKTLEEWKEELLGKKFYKLTVLNIQQHIRKSTGRKDGYEAICRCDCGNTSAVQISHLVSGITTSCGCVSRESSRNNIKKAQQWYKEHPEEAREILKNCANNMLRWQSDHPEESKQQKQEAIKQANQWRKEHPEEVKNIDKKRIEKAKEWRVSNPELALNISRNNIKKAHLWHKEHDKESKEIINKAQYFAHKWQKENPNEFRQIYESALHKATLWHRHNRIKSRELLKYSRYKANLKRLSKEEDNIYRFLLSLNYNVDQQFLVEDHYFDFRVNNYLIEYNGSVYHYTDYKNLSNPDSKDPPSIRKEVTYHKKLRDLAIKNGYSLIQIWDYQWKNNKDFIQKLIIDQLNGTSNYRDYLDEEGLLNNDYGFSVDGEQINPRSQWISTGYCEIVKESYCKGRVLIYNSGYTKVIQ